MGNYKQAREKQEARSTSESINTFLNSIGASEKKSRTTSAKEKTTLKTAKNSQNNERKAPRKLNNSENKSEVIHIRITPSEYNKLTEKAIKEGARTISEYAYKLIKRGI